MKRALFFVVAIILGMISLTSVAQTHKATKQKTVIRKKPITLTSSKSFYCRGVKMGTNIQTFRSELEKKGFKYKCGNKEDDYPQFTFVGKRNNINVELFVECGYQGKFVHSVIYTEDGLTYQQAKLRKKQLTQDAINENGNMLGRGRKDDELMHWGSGTLKIFIRESYTIKGAYALDADFGDRNSYTEYVKNFSKLGNPKNKKYEYIDMIAIAEKVLSQRDVAMAYNVLEGNNFVHGRFDNFCRMTKNCELSYATLYYDNKNSPIKKVEFFVEEKYMPDIREKLLAKGYRFISGSDKDPYLDDMSQGGKRDSFLLYQNGRIFVVLQKSYLDNKITYETFSTIPPCAPIAPLCPPHRYEIVSENGFSSKKVSENTSAPESSLPPTISYSLGKNKVELCRMEAADGSVYYISRKPVNSDLWGYAMIGDNSYDLSDPLFYNDKCYNRVMDFFVKLNEKTRNQNIPFSFMLPSFEELKEYATNPDFDGSHPSFVDSIMISNFGEPLTLEQYMALKNKTGVSLLGGILKGRDIFEGVSLNDSSKTIQFYLKAVPDNQQMEVEKSSVTRIGLLKTVLMRCKKCGKTVNVFRRSKAQTIQQMIESVDEEDSEDDNNYSFCNNLIRLSEESLIHNRLFVKKWRVDRGDGKVANYTSSDGKYKIMVKKNKKKDTNVESVELKFEDTNADDIFQAIKELGYKELKRQLNVPTSDGSVRNYRYDWYRYIDDEGYIIFLSIFTYKNNDLSIHVSFLKSK